MTRPSFKQDYAIGVFDSGVGGLTVVKELIRRLPHEDIVYFGDTARVPYGTKSREAIIRFSMENAVFLLKHRVKMIVVACNSSSSFALPELRKIFSLPIVGVIEPGARKAVSQTKNKRIGVIATSATISSGKYEATILGLDRRVKVVNQSCPLFVPLAEEGWFDKKVTADIAREYLAPIARARADVVILGCTHYPLLRKMIQRVLGPKVALVDSAKEVAGLTEKVLIDNGLLRPGSRRGKHRFYVSDKPQHFGKLAGRFLGYPINNVKKV